jgi:hypothetical protein
MAWLGRNAPALTLFFLAPAVAELLTGSMPPVEFLRETSPLVIALYGCGALLIREAVRGWRKGYLSLLLLGIAYGVLEEGLFCKTFFDPHWAHLHPLAGHGRWLGTNWVWAIWMVLFHAVISIGVPILLVEVAFPMRRAERWVAGTWRPVLLGVLALDVLLGYYRLSAFRPPAPHSLIAVALVLALVVTAGRLPGRASDAGVARQSARPIFLWATGFLWMLLSALTFYGLPETPLAPPVTALIGLTITAAAGWVVLRLSGSMATWDDRGRFLLGAGVLSFWIGMGPLWEFAHLVPNDPRGMALVALAALLMLVWQGRRIYQRAAERTGEAPRPGAITAHVGQWAESRGEAREQQDSR